MTNLAKNFSSLSFLSDFFSSVEKIQALLVFSIEFVRLEKPNMLKCAVGKNCFKMCIGKNRKTEALVVRSAVSRFICPVTL